MEIIPVILAGGAGERLWPLSRADYPKQFAVRNKKGKSLFQTTIERVNDGKRFGVPIIVCHQDHRYIVAEQLREIGCEEATIILEPEARNTAPAIALAAAHLVANGSASLMLVLPSDHYLERAKQFRQTLADVGTLAESGHIVTFGVAPTSPETGYGYIQAGELLNAATDLCSIAGFTEKPDVATASAYLLAGNYYWNSGMYFMRADSVLEAIKLHAPEIHAACKEAYAKCVFDGLFLRPNKAVLESCPSISFDCAVMEKVSDAVMMPLTTGWSDLGCWTSLDEHASKDRDGNSITGQAVIEDVSDCYLYSTKPLISVIGLADTVVVATEDSVLVGPKSRMQEIKHLLAKMRAAALPNTHLTQLFHRPWGQFRALDGGDNYQVKKLFIKPGAKISLQTHQQRSEHWVVVHGIATVTRGEEKLTLTKNQSVHIQPGQTHRLENTTAEDLIVIEVQIGDYLGEDDIQRLEDIYQRCEPVT